MNIYRIF